MNSEPCALNEILKHEELEFSLDLRPFNSIIGAVDKKEKGNKEKSSSNVSTMVFFFVCGYYYGGLDIL